MEKAKQAVRNFVPGGDKHRTTIDQEVRAPITEQQIRPEQHEQITTAVDKEIHQDHHHTVVQPIVHKERLPEQHSHNLAAVEHKTFQHGNERDLNTHLERDAAKFQDQSVTHKTQHTSTAAPVVAGERTYHHVHEHIQPVIQKETIAPHVVHTTIPIHETHHAQALHHGTSTLPTKTLEEFQSGGGVLEAASTRHVKEFDGCPDTYQPGMQNEQLSGDKHGHHGGAAAAVAGGAAVGAAAHHHHEKDRAGNLSSIERGLDSTTGRGLGSTNERGVLGSHGDRHDREGLGSTTDRLERTSLGDNRGGFDSRSDRDRTLGSTGTTGTTGHSHAQSAAAAAAGTAAAGAMGENRHKHGSNTYSENSDRNTSSINNPNVNAGDSRAIFNSTGNQGTRDSGISMSQDKNALSSANPSNTRHAHDSYGDKNLASETSNTQARKPSLLDRLNPRKDTDHDGKKGFLD